jgi:hypothetical protein
MGDTHDEKAQENPVCPAAAERLFSAIRKIIKAKDSPHGRLTCNVCHCLITLDLQGVCADENGKPVHASCYVQNVIASSKSPVPRPEHD